MNNTGRQIIAALEKVSSYAHDLRIAAEERDVLHALSEAGAPAKVWDQIRRDCTDCISSPLKLSHPYSTALTPRLPRGSHCKRREMVQIVRPYPTFVDR